MTHAPRANLALIAAFILALSAGPARAGDVTIDDLVRIRGMESNPLIGMGIVIGLDGTGDSSKKSHAAARPFAELLKSMANPVMNLDELADANGFALVAVTMTIGETGGQVGDRFMVHVNKLFNAKSLEGGYLLPCLLRLPGRDDPDAIVYAEATGVLRGAPNDPASATISDGGALLESLRNQPVVNEAGYMWLSIHNPYASWAVASRIAEEINEPESAEIGFEAGRYQRIARAMDAKTVRVRVPDPDRTDPANFIAELMTRTVDTTLLDLPARIVIDERRGLLIVTGDVVIDPVAVSHDGMTVSALDTGGASSWIGLDSSGGASPRAARLADLMTAFELMRVSVADQISIIEGLKQTGALHAEIVRP